LLHLKNIVDDTDGGIFANSAAIIAIDALWHHRKIAPNKVILVSLGTGDFDDKPYTFNDIENGNSWILPAATGISTFIASICSRIPYINTFKSAIISSTVVSIATSVISNYITSLQNYGFGEINWITKADLIGKMMK